MSPGEKEKCKARLIGAAGGFIPLATLPDMAGRRVEVAAEVAVEVLKFC